MSFKHPHNVRFECKRCGKCCCDTPERKRHILLLKNDVEKISKGTGLVRELFSIKKSGFEPYIYEMRKGKNGKCFFLNNTFCTIYEIRPLLCRFYPFSLEKIGFQKYVFKISDECPEIGYGGFLKKKYFYDLFKLALESFRK